MAPNSLEEGMRLSFFPGGGYPCLKTRNLSCPSQKNENCVRVSGKTERRRLHMNL